MIMDSKCYLSLLSSAFTNSHCSMNSSAEPIQREVRHQLAPSTFAAAIAEFNDWNGSFDTNE